jgi:hypothetical protein
MPAPRIHFADDNFCVGFWNNIALVDTVVEIDVARMRQLFAAYKQLLMQYPSIAVLCVLREGAPLSSGDARAEAGKLSRDLGDALLRVAFVLEEGGVVAQLFRTVIRGYNQLTRTAKLTVDTSLDEAVFALAPLVIPAGERTRVSTDLKDAFATLSTRWKPRA